MVQTDDVVAVVSAFRPPRTFVDNVAALARQVGTVVVVDDSADAASSLATRTSLAAFGNVRFVANPCNVGLATTLNRGVEEAARMGAAYVLTLDQDTLLPDGYVRRIRMALVAAEAASDKVLYAVPESVAGRLHRELHEGPSGMCSLGALQSGLLVRRDAFDVVGTFRDEFVIDAIEPDFFGRLHRFGFHGVISEGLDLPHLVGHPSQVLIAGRAISTSNQPPFRRYYITRNSLAVVRENWRSSPSWSRGLLRWVIKDAIKSVTIDSGRISNGGAVLRGVKDFVFGRYGRRHGP